MPIGSGIVYNTGDLILSQVSSSDTAFLETKIAAATSSLIYFDSTARINSASLNSITVGTASYVSGSTSIITNLTASNISASGRIIASVISSSNAYFSDIGFTNQTVAPDTSVFPTGSTSDGLILDGGTYTNGLYRTRFVKVDRSSNLPLYIQETTSTSGSFRNLSRFGTHANSPNTFEVFGSTNIQGAITSSNFVGPHIGNTTGTSSWSTNALTASSLVAANSYAVNNFTASNISCSGYLQSAAAVYQQITSSTFDSASYSNQWVRIAKFDFNIPGTIPFGGFFDEFALKIIANPVSGMQPYSDRFVSPSVALTGSNRGNYANLLISNASYAATPSINVLNAYTYGTALVTKIRSAKDAGNSTWYVDAFITNQSASAVDLMRVEIDSGRGQLQWQLNPSTASYTSNVEFDITIPGVKNANSYVYNFDGNVTSSGNILVGGRVGIGTTAPADKLSVISGSVRIATSSLAGALYLGNDGSNIYLQRDNSYDLSLVQNGDSNSALYLASAGSVYVNIDSNNNDTDKAFIVQNNALKAGTELFRIQENGNVGVGTTSPAAKLHIYNGSSHFEATSNGNAAIVAGLYALQIGPLHDRDSTAGRYYGGIAFNHLLNFGGGTTYNGAPQAWIGTRLQDTTGSERDYLVFATKPGTGVSGTGNDIPLERMCIDRDGLVGIGTTSPAYKLDVIGPATSNGVTLRLSDAASLANSRHILLTRGSVSGSIGIAGSQTEDPLWLSRSSGYDLIVASSGNIGIGTSIPGALLEISSSTAASLLNVKGAGGNGILFVSGSGNVGIGTTLPNSKLEVAGTAGTAIVSVNNTSANRSGSFGIDGNGVFIRNSNDGDYFDLKNASGVARFRVIYDNATHLTTNFVSIGNLSATGSKLSVFGNTSIGSTYGSTAAPTNGLIVEGNVGIGTTVPGVKLEISGSSNSALLNIKSPSSSTILYVSGSGAVGVGTSAYTEIGGNGYLMLKNVLCFVSDNTANSNNRNWSIGTNGQFNGDLYFVTSAGSSSFPNDAYRISFTRTGDIITNGSIGVGTTVPVNKLQVNGNVSGSSFTSSISNAVGFLGTSSWASNALTASFLPVGTYNITSSWANNVVSASYALSSSFATTAQTANALNTANSYTVGSLTSTTQIGGTTGTIQSLVTPGIYSNGLSTGNAIAITSNTTFANQGAWVNLGLHQTTANANDLTAKVYLAVGGWYQNSGTGLPVYIGGGYTSNSSSVLSVVPTNTAGAGNVGIGTPNPLGKLHITSSATNGESLVYLSKGSGSITQHYITAVNQLGQLNYRVSSDINGHASQTLYYAGTPYVYHDTYWSSWINNNNYTQGGLGIGTNSQTHGYGLTIAKPATSGSLYVSGSSVFTGSVSINGLLNATASWANNVVSASFATIAQTANALNASNTYTVAGLTSAYVDVTGAGTIPTTGIYRPSTKTLGLSADSTLIFKISNASAPATSSIETGNFIVQSGNVGIGTANATDKLTVYGALASYKNGADTIQTQVYLANAGNTRAFNLQLNSGGTGLDLWSFNSSNAWLKHTTFNYDGNVGIGTAAPAAKLEITGSSNSALLNIKSPISGAILYVSGSGAVGIGTSNVGAFTLQVSGSFGATTKSFIIDHPTKAGKKLMYGSLESPYHGIRLTGRDTLVNGKCKVELPDYMYKLILHDSINIQLTGIKCNKTLYVDDINIPENYFTIAYDKAIFESYKDYDFFWDFTAIRADVPELTTEL